MAMSSSSSDARLQTRHESGETGADRIVSCALTVPWWCWQILNHARRFIGFERGTSCRIICISMKLAGPTRRTVLALGGFATLGGWSAARGQLVTPPAASSLQANQAALDEVWETARDRFYDLRLHELDWPGLRQRYQLVAASAASAEELAVVINTMLAELGASHTRYYTPEETAYYQLADIFVGALRHRGLERVFPSGEVTYPGIGVFTHVDDRG